jgi:hypothetical protein
MNPTTRLFLSADIAGSTAYKQKQMKDNTVEWPSVFISFFSGLPGIFQNELLRTESLVRDGYSGFIAAAAPRMWKAIGDELVLWQDVETEHQVAVSVLAWRDALRAFREILEKENLGVKGAAWIGSFPFPNREIAIPKNLNVAYSPGQPISANEQNLANEEGYLIDFIGPHIDAGFRLAARSTTRRMVTSIDVAEILANVPTGHIPDKHMFYGGSVELKGVHSGIPYPVFWLDCDYDSPMATTEDRLLGKVEASDVDVVKMAECTLRAVGTEPILLIDAMHTRYKTSQEKTEHLCIKVEEFAINNPETPVDTTDGEEVPDVPGPDLTDKVAELKRVLRA